MGGQQAIAYQDRSELVCHATAHLPWLEFDEWEKLQMLCERYPHLRFVEFDMNGADDVVKYEKWQHASDRNRMITIGRPGFTKRVREGIRACGAAERNCMLGPELPDISSTAA